LIQTTQLYSHFPLNSLKFCPLNSLPETKQTQAKGVKIDLEERKMMNFNGLDNDVCIIHLKRVEGEIE